MLRRLLPMLTALVMAAAGAAAEPPQRHVVTDLPPGEALNVRAEPSAAAADIGDLGDGALVEVLRTDAEKRWGQIVHGEGNGWIALRYARPVEPERVGESPIPAGLICTGTEPFWSLRIDGAERVVFAEPGDEGVVEREAEVEWAGAASGRSGFPAALRAGSGLEDYALVLRPGACRDGMSDRVYGWAAELLAGQRLLTGCCRLDPEAE